MKIGVFDSGVGGLTVLRALLPRIANAEYLYLGDTARLPYGSKSQTTIARYAVSSSQFLDRPGLRIPRDRLQHRQRARPRRDPPDRRAARHSGRRRHRTRRRCRRRRHRHPRRPGDRNLGHRAEPRLRRRLPTLGLRASKRPARCSSRSSKKAGSTTPSPPRSSASISPNSISRPPKPASFPTRSFSAAPTIRCSAKSSKQPSANSGPASPRRSSTPPKPRPAKSSATRRHSRPR